MKIKIITYRIFIFLFIILLSFSLKILAQETKNEILVYLKPNVINVDLGYKDFIILDSTVIKSKSFLLALKKSKMHNIKRAMVDFDLSDTLKYTSDGKPIKMLNLSRMFKIELPNNVNADSIILKLDSLSDVIYAEKNGGWELYTNDPHYTKQWYLKNTGQFFGSTIGDDIKAEEAWQIFTGNSNIKIGVIGTGVKKDHEDLNGKVTGDDPDYSWHDPNKIWFDKLYLCSR